MENKMNIEDAAATPETPVIEETENPKEEKRARECACDPSVAEFLEDRGYEMIDTDAMTPDERVKIMEKMIDDLYRNAAVAWSCHMSGLADVILHSLWALENLDPVSVKLFWDGQKEASATLVGLVRRAGLSRHEPELAMTNVSDLLGLLSGAMEAAETEH